MLTDSLEQSALAFVLTIAFVANAYGDPLGHTSRTDFPHPVTLEVSLGRSTFGAKEPLHIHISLTNLGSVPFLMTTRLDGVPYGLVFEVAKEGEQFQGRSYWLRRSGPEQTTTELMPGKRAVGELLILLDYGRGYVFGEPGPYRIRARWSPGKDYEPIYSDEFDIDIRASTPKNGEFRSELGWIGLRRNVGELPAGVDLDSVEGKEALERQSVLLLAKIVNTRRPHLVDPARRPEDQKEAELVEQLRDLLERYPDSSYSGYIARYLGLVHLKTLAHEYSLAAGAARRETGQEMKWNALDFRGDPEYQQALHYLTTADKADIWPRTCAQYNLAWLHGMARDWDKAEASCNKLRSEYADLNGAQLADQLEETIQKFKNKLSLSESAPNR